MLKIKLISVVLFCTSSARVGTIATMAVESAFIARQTSSLAYPPHGGRTSFACWGLTRLSSTGLACPSSAVTAWSVLI
jgi:hypothetical protein